MSDEDGFSLLIRSTCGLSDLSGESDVTEEVIIWRNEDHLEYWNLELCRRYGDGSDQFIHVDLTEELLVDLRDNITKLLENSNG